MLKDGTTRLVAGAYHPLHDPVSPLPYAVSHVLQACRLDVFREPRA
ncbi:MAG: hypothetical protein Q4G43_07430 [Mobilicoccus sp.]|nr:hypothetical protein [Mobilicoccus sp.]